MKTFYRVVIFAAWLIIVRTIRPCRAADNNSFIVASCPATNISTIDTVFDLNRRALMETLALNAASNNGFYMTHVEENGSKIYGITQCRGDISAEDCIECTKNSTERALDFCPEGKNAWILYRWCFVRYSNESFFGVLEGSMVVVGYTDTNFDEPSVASQGLAFMKGLVSSAPQQPLLFQIGTFDVGQSGKKYGMVQCRRDLNRSSCEKCLDNQLTGIGVDFANRTRWEVHVSSCSLWYDDYEFYFNASSLQDGGGARLSSVGGFTIGITIAVLSFLVAL